MGVLPPLCRHHPLRRAAADPRQRAHAKPGQVCALPVHIESAAVQGLSAARGAQSRPAEARHRQDAEGQPQQEAAVRGGRVLPGRQRVSLHVALLRWVSLITDGVCVCQCAFARCCSREEPQRTVVKRVDF